MAEFIGVKALTEVAKKFESDIVLGAAYFRPDIFERLKIKVIEGVQFKNIAYVFARKGHTTYRKRNSGTHAKNQAGFVEERTMVCRLTMNRFFDNEDNYVEEAIYPVSGTAEYSYPASELAFNAITANYGEDLFDCLFHGDDSIEDSADNAYLNLYSGFITNINKDVEDGRVSVLRKNIVSIGAIEYPASVSDIGAWSEVIEFRNSWSQNLKNAPEVLVYCNDVTGAAIAQAYANKNGNFRTVQYVGDGNFKVSEWNNVTFCPESSFGTGDKLIATTPYNFEYGVNTLDSRTGISVRQGSDNDNKDVIFQIQSIQGTRVRNANPAAFCMSNGSLSAISGSGDFTTSTYDVGVNIATMGSVTVGGTTQVAGTEYAVGTTLVLVATPASGHEFVRWSNGKTDASISVVTTYYPQAITAIFKATA